MGIKAISLHLRKYLIFYTILATLLALPIGYYYRAEIAHNKALISNLVTIIAALTIFPSMIQLKTEGFVKSFKDWKSIAIFSSYTFVLFPVIAMTLAPTLGDPHVGVGFVAANAVPASSASLGYVFIVGGSVELAAALAIVSIAVGLPVIPLIIKSYANIASISVPIEPIIISLTEVLIVPLLLGQLTRFAAMRKKGRNYVDEFLKPLFSFWTMLGILSLVFLLIFSQAAKIISNPFVAIMILVYQVVAIFGVFALALGISKALHIKYENHQAIVLLSVGKNESVAAAVTTSALGPQAAIAPALIPMVQPIAIIAYLNMENWVKRFLGYGKSGEEESSEKKGHSL